MTDLSPETVERMVTLTHLQARRLRQLDMMHRKVWKAGGVWLTSHWNASKAANQRLCDLGLAERYGHEKSVSGKFITVGDVRITPAGLAFLATSTTASDQGRG